MPSAAEILAAGDVYREDEFLAPPQLDALRAAMQARAAAGGFCAAQIGGGSRRQRSALLRGDSTCWLDEPYLPAEQQLFGRLEQLRLQLNQTLSLGLFEIEAHYARYPVGARYARHIDQPLGKAQRVLTFVLYLNEAWDAATGGALRVYQPDGGYDDIVPCGGRLVAFLTAGREHEVLPAARERISLSGWMRRRET